MSSVPSIKQAEDVCSALTHLSRTSRQSQTVECVTSPKGSIQLSLEEVSEPLMPEGEPQVSVRLSQILSRLKPPSSQTPRFARCHRAKVAFLLAQAVLQLHSSPWLSSSWSSADIQLLAIPSDRTLASSWQPFISKKIDPPSTHQTVPKSTKHLGPYVRSRELYALAIVLLELAFNTPLHQKRIEEDIQGAHSHQDAWINHNTACRLTDSDDLVCEVGPDYTDAVKRCIYGFENVTAHDLNTEQFHNAVYAGVIEPLERNLELTAPRGWY